MVRVTDQLGQEVCVETQFPRIVSLCPSTTETAVALGAQLVGCTDYCRHPAETLNALPRVGGTKTVRLSRLAALKPDLVVSVKEENREDQVREIAKHWPTLILDPLNTDSAIQGVRLLGKAAGVTASADELADQLAADVLAWPDAQGLRVAYLIWRKPYMVVGANTYLHDVMSRLGMVNVGADLPGRYPEVDADSLGGLAPQLLLAASEPFAFGAKHLAELEQFVPPAVPVLVDGEMFSWHGQRMRLASAYFAQLIPELQRVAVATHR